MRVTSIRTWFNEGGGHWQTNIGLNYNWKYTFGIAFESWALNETYANIQRDAINIKVNQIIERGEVMRMLLYHGGGTHIHFGMRENNNDICSYQFLSPEAKLIFHDLWIKYGYGNDSYYND